MKRIVDRPLRRRTWRSCLLFPALAASSIVAIAGVADAAPGVGPWDGRASYGAFWTETNGRSDILGMSDDGRYVTYLTSATNLTSEDTNTRLDCFLYDRWSGLQWTVSLALNGYVGNAQSVRSAPNARMLTLDGSYVLFTSYASDLVTGDTNGQADVFIRDTNIFGITERVSLRTGGTQISGSSFALGMSADAQKVLFSTKATISTWDTNNVSDVYLYDRATRTTSLVSSDLAGIAVGSNEAVMDESGTRIAFTTMKSIDPADTNSVNDVYFRDLLSGMNRMISIGASGDSPNGASEHPAISGDGARVGFISRASNLVPGDTNGAADVFVRPVGVNALFRASTKSDGSQVAAPGCERVSLNGNGHVVSLACRSGELVPGDTNGQMDVFVKMVDSNAITLVSRVQNGAIGNGDSGYPVISRDGTQVGFTSDASNLVPPDGNGVPDVFVGVAQ